MGIVGHEYTHAITNRMVGGPDEGLTSEQGGAMGESWGDLVAAEYHVQPRLRQRRQPLGRRRLRHRQRRDRASATTRSTRTRSTTPTTASTPPAPRCTPTARSGTAPSGRSARRWSTSTTPRFPYADAGAAAASARRRTRHATARCRPRHCPGNRRWVQLMFDSFLLQQGATSMLDARDAMLAADRMRFDGANQDVLWRAFARRGMGVDASARPATTPSRRRASPRRPPQRHGDLRGHRRRQGLRRRLRGPRHPGRRHRSGHARSAPPPRSRPATYEMLASPPTTASRGSRSPSPRRRRHARPCRWPTSANLAAAAAGATVIGATAGSLNAESLIDGTEATNWGGVTDGQRRRTQPVRRGRPRRRRADGPPGPGQRAADPGPGRRRRGPARPDGPRLGLAVHRAAPVRARGVHRGCDSADATWTRFYTSPDRRLPGRRGRDRSRRT